MNRQELEWALRAFRDRRPYQPFIVEFFSGDRLLVRHPEAMAFEGDLLVYTAPGQPTSYRLFTAESVCQLLDKGA